MAYRLRLAPVRGNRAGLFFRCHEADLDIARDAFRRFREDAHDWWDVTLGPPTRRRSLDQNALWWALLTIEAMETDGTPAAKDRLHEDHIAEWAPAKLDEHGRVLMVRPRLLDGTRGDPVPVQRRTSEMTTAEMAQMVERLFGRLAEIGVGLENAQAIRSYWIEWTDWRARAKRDPITYENIGDFRRRQPWCSACVLRQGEHIAHIVSRGAGGSDEPSNLLHLCSRCHREQHEQGWDRFLATYPHLRRQVEEENA